MTYSEARDHLVSQLERIANAHELGRYGDIELEFDELDALVPRGMGPEFGKLLTALTFWDSWIDAANHEWQYYPAISRDDWPLLARRIAADLRADREISDPLLLENFDLTKRGQDRRRLGEFLRRLLGR